MAAIFPNIPNVPGVPPIPRDPFAAVASVALMAADTFNFIASIFGPQWGIFDRAGIPVVLADNVVSLDYKQQWNISDYPVEAGGFESYNKVATPFSVKIRFSAGGGTASNLIGGFINPLAASLGLPGLIKSRKGLLDSIAIIAGTTELFNVVTPEAIYRNANITSYDYRRSAPSIGLVVVDVHCAEVRERTATLFTNTQLPAGASSVDQGPVQTDAVTTQQETKIQEGGIGHA